MKEMLEMIHEEIAFWADNFDLPPERAREVRSISPAVDALFRLRERVEQSVATTSAGTKPQCSWQSIESAPRDGSAVFAWREGWDYPDWVRWIRNPRTETEFWNDSHELDAYEMEQAPPTHWLPMPTPPGWAEKYAGTQPKWMAPDAAGRDSQSVPGGGGFLRTEGVMDNWESGLKELGFENEAELYSMVARVDISTPAKLAAFKAWQENDGSKAGLLALGQVP